MGLDGESEHCSALIHTLQFGDDFRKAAEATTLLPAVEKRGRAGVTFDIPLRHKADATIRAELARRPAASLAGRDRGRRDGRVHWD
ncbi:hypothetical protein GCM10027090_39590 [Sinomonas soli]